MPRVATKWRQHCVTARKIREYFGVQSAVEYLIDEKLLALASAAERDPSLAAEFPTLVQRLFDVLMPEELDAALRRHRNLPMIVRAALRPPLRSR